MNEICRLLRLVTHLNMGASLALLTWIATSPADGNHYAALPTVPHSAQGGVR